MLRVVIDQEKCCGAGSCVRTAPEIFAQNDDDGLVVVLNTFPPAALRDVLDEAIDICPAGVISVEELSDEAVPAEAASAEVVSAQVISERPAGR